MADMASCDQKLSAPCAVTAAGGAAEKVLDARAQQGTTSSTAATNDNGSTKPKKKICCACPETKSARDMCMVEKGSRNIRNSTLLCVCVFIEYLCSYTMHTFGTGNPCGKAN